MKFSTLLILGFLFITNLKASTHSIFADPYGTYAVTVANPRNPLNGKMTVSKVTGGIQVTVKLENNPNEINLTNVQLTGDNLTGDFNSDGLSGTVTLQFSADNNFTGSIKMIDKTAVPSFNDMQINVSGIKQ